MNGQVRQIMSAAEVKALAAKAKPEKDIQSESVDALKKLGYEVLVNNAGLRREAAEALRKAGITKGAVFQTPGIPDISVRRPTYPKGHWVLIEFKTQEGQMTKAQERIHNLGGSYLCRSLDDVLAALREVENDPSLKTNTNFAA